MLKPALLLKIPQEYSDEIRGISKATGIPLGISFIKNTEKATNKIDLHQIHIHEYQDNIQIIIISLLCNNCGKKPQSKLSIKCH